MAAVTNEKKQYHNMSVALFENNMQNKKEKSPDFFVKFLSTKKEDAKDGKNKWEIIGSGWKQHSGTGMNLQLDLDKIALYSK